MSLSPSRLAVMLRDSGMNDLNSHSFSLKTETDKGKIHIATICHNLAVLLQKTLVNLNPSLPGGSAAARTHLGGLREQLLIHRIWRPPK